MKNNPLKRKYHGWVAVDKGDAVLDDTIAVEYMGDDGVRRRVVMETHGNAGAIAAVEWWDKRLGQHVQLEPVLKGCYRVYTQEES